MKKKFTRDLVFSHEDYRWGAGRKSEFDVHTLAGTWLIALCVSIFCRTLKLPADLIRNRKQKVRITIELLGDIE